MPKTKPRSVKDGATNRYRLRAAPQLEASACHSTNLTFTESSARLRRPFAMAARRGRVQAQLASFFRASGARAAPRSQARPNRADARPRRARRFGGSTNPTPAESNARLRHQCGRGGTGAASRSVVASMLRAAPQSAARPRRAGEGARLALHSQKTNLRQRWIPWCSCPGRFAVYDWAS